MRQEHVGRSPDPAPERTRHEEHDEGLRSAAEASAAVHAGRSDALDAGHWTALQRTAGNAAVIQAQAQAQAGAAVRQALAGPGRPLDAGFRAEAEQHLGADLSTVRVHDDAGAAASAEAVQANAYTSGNHVVFGTGQLDTQSPSGRNRLVHELAHTVQQRQGAVEGTVTQAGLSISDPSDRFEREADEVASTFD